MHIEPNPKILLLIPHLGGGGAEQVMSLLAQGLSHEKYELHLVLVAQADIVPVAMPPWINIHTLRASRVRAGAIGLLRLIWRLKPDLILSGMFHLNFLALLLRPFYPLGTRVIVRQNGTVSAALSSRRLPGYTRFLYRLLYRHADLVICQSDAMARDISGQLSIAPEQLVVLRNPLNIDAIRTVATEHSSRWIETHEAASGPHLLAVGRLSEEKGFDLLLQALAIVRRQYSEADLLIVGSGAEDASLKAQCRKLGLQSVVKFAGQVDRPAAFFRDASLFVLSSRHEGMPNALLEAAAGGLPIAALPASGGVTDLLRDQPGVWLSKEVSAQALAGTLLAAFQALQPGERFAHPFIEEFRLARVLQDYESVLDMVLLDRRVADRKFTSIREGVH